MRKTIKIKLDKTDKIKNVNIVSYDIILLINSKQL